MPALHGPIPGLQPWLLGLAVVFVATSASALEAIRTEEFVADLIVTPRLADAAAIMAKEPIALPPVLQTLVEVASENDSTTIFPVSIDILKPFLSTKGDHTA